MEEVAADCSTRPTHLLHSEISHTEVLHFALFLHREHLPPRVQICAHGAGEHVEAGAGCEQLSQI